MVIFTIRSERLAVLLRRRDKTPYAGCWGLPGGRVHADETLEQAAVRQLAEKTGITGVYLEQLYTFGDPARDPRGRVIAVSYYALVPYNRLKVQAQPSELAWHRVDALPPLAFDHGKIVAMAQERLCAKLDYSTIALQFMPEKFTLSELQAVYESILGEALDKRNFRKRVQALDCLEDTGEQFRAGKHRPAKLFRLKTPGRVEIIK
ncbi:NUDIX hydrolase [Alkalilimnicola ehrlichii]|uniref:NUDIX hydrolase n=2 Tax=Alkalilimnicola ehrlichii TaxID=351052 RepID=A0A3E0X0T2_9GAMM|nr:NUDIX hydrolase [Alkalilimnicola ehrlichii]RFA39022.1 NUDIX hydrolase [Alkalilimnicola ehrlichii]